MKYFSTPCVVLPRTNLTELAGAPANLCCSVTRLANDVGVYHVTEPPALEEEYCFSSATVLVKTETKRPQQME